MRVHCGIISLARAGDRRALMAAELARAGVAADWLDAIDGAAVPEATLLAECRPEGPWGIFKPKDMACTLSHARLWERFLASEADLCLVLEDDVFLSPDLAGWLADTSWWPLDADIVKLERWRDDRLLVFLDALGAQHQGRQLRRMHSRHSGSAAYMLNRRAARALLEARPFNVTIDQLLFHVNASPVARGLTRYQVSPALAVQGNEPPALPGAPRPPRQRLRGVAALRQALKRGWRELGYPPATWARLALGRIRAEKITYAPGPLPAAPQ